MFWELDSEPLTAPKRNCGDEPADGGVGCDCGDDCACEAVQCVQHEDVEGERGSMTVEVLGLDGRFLLIIEVESERRDTSWSLIALFDRLGRISNFRFNSALTSIPVRWLALLFLFQQDDGATHTLFKQYPL